MLRRWGPLAAAAAALLLLPGPVSATSTADAWMAAGCPPEYVDSPANGIDSTIVRLPRSGMHIRVVYSSDVALPWARVTAQTVDGDCRPLGAPVLLRHGGAAFMVPDGAVWLVIHHPGHVGFRCIVS